VPDDSETAVLIMVTAGGRDDAERLGEGLVVERLAAHCSVVPMVHSFYYSNGLLQRATEALLMVKTVRSRSGAVYEYLRKHHSYEMPEIYEVAIDDGSPQYLRWLAEQVAKPGSDR
jgi:periplasmic divalent cation tolerance protein